MNVSNALFYRIEAQQYYIKLKTLNGRWSMAAMTLEDGMGWLVQCQKLCLTGISHYSASLIELLLNQPKSAHIVYNLKLNLNNLVRVILLQLTSLRSKSLFAGFVTELHNVALGKPTEQISTYLDGTSDKAVDGEKTASSINGNCMQTKLEVQPWWKVDLQELYLVYELHITNQVDCCGTTYYIIFPNYKELVATLNYKQCHSNSIMTNIIFQYSNLRDIFNNGTLINFGRYSQFSYANKSGM